MKAVGPMLRLPVQKDFPGLSTEKENPRKALGLSEMRQQSLEMKEVKTDRREGRKYWRRGS